jgi:hypothetical protein
MERNIEISGPLQRRSRFLSCKAVAEKRNSESVPRSRSVDIGTGTLLQFRGKLPPKQLQKNRLRHILRILRVSDDTISRSIGHGVELLEEFFKLLVQGLRNQIGYIHGLTGAPQSVNRREHDLLAAPMSGNRHIQEISGLLFV